MVFETDETEMEIVTIPIKHDAVTPVNDKYKELVRRYNLARRGSEEERIIETRMKILVKVNKSLQMSFFDKGINNAPFFLRETLRDIILKK